MDKHYFIKLLRKYLDGNGTKEEQQFLVSYYNLFQHEPDVTDMLTEEERQAFKEDIRVRMWNNISGESQAQRIKHLNKRIIKIAAAAVLFIGLAGGVFFFSKPVRKQTDNTPVAHQKENRVILLPDGSTVILSPGSKLNYPSSFDGKEKREVFLYGQAFFEIEHNAARPFVVHTGSLETVVLGTSFNVKAIPGEADIIVTVKNGKVRVSDQDNVLGVITPKQQIIYNKGRVSSVMKEVDNDSYLDWKEQDLLFDNLTIAEAARLLEQQYKVKIIIDDQSIRSQRFTATFPKSENLERALESMCVFNGVTYKYNREEATVIIGNK